ncbi:MAG: hypothetical protein GWP58_13480, partial [Gammaproteobacteria bacterium]|nr:hypothetical protein [Gammaproteobacteria bacterium]
MNSSVIAKEKAGLGQRFDFWILERVRQRRGVTQLPLTFEYRHIYVMPTRFGFWFGMLLALTALGGLNFNNNMALMLGFLLASIAQLTTLLAYRNLVGITVNSIRAKPVFAGDSARFRVLLKNTEGRNRFAIQAVSSQAGDCTDIQAESPVQLALKQPTFQRGW